MTVLIKLTDRGERLFVSAQLKTCDCFTEEAIRHQGVYLDCELEPLERI